MRGLFLMIVLILVGCAPAMKLIPAPVMYQDAEANHFALTSLEDRSAVVSVFYAVTGNPKGPYEGTRARFSRTAGRLHLVAV